MREPNISPEIVDYYDQYPGRDEQLKKGEKELRDNLGRYSEGIAKTIEVMRGNDVSTVFYLDKSARYAGHIVRKVWGVLQDKGMIREGEKLPEFRYINLDSNNDLFNDSSMIEGKYKIPEKGRILVADEYTGSGNTLAKATETIEKLFPGREVLAHSVFKWMLPFWYSSKLPDIAEVKGGDWWVMPFESKKGKYFRELLDKFAGKIAGKILATGLDEFDSVPMAGSEGPGITFTLGRLNDKNKRILGIS